MPNDLDVFYDPRGLMWCWKCFVLMPYGTLREGDEAVSRHRHDNPLGGYIRQIRNRRKGWRKNGKALAAKPST